MNFILLKTKTVQLRPQNSNVACIWRKLENDLTNVNGGMFVC